MRFTFSIWGLSALAALGILSACERQAPPPALPQAVKLLTVGTSVSGQTSQHSYSGEVHAHTESALGFRVGGKLVQRQVDVGQHVAAGQLLAELDPSDYALGARAAQAQVQAAATARDLAQADVKRFESLRDDGFISDAQLDKIHAQAQSAQAQLAQAQAQAQAQGNQVAYSQLRADKAGIVTQVFAETGQVLAPGQAVVQLAHDGRRDVVFALAESLYDTLRVGAPVRIESWAPSPSADAPSWAGRVREIAASADPITRTFSVKASMDGQTSAPALGSTVRIWPLAAAGRQDRITLPLSAISKQGDETLVWMYNPPQKGDTWGTVSPRSIQADAIVGNTVQVRSGLKVGEQIVAAGSHILTSGQTVRPYEGKPGATLPPALSQQE